MDGVGLDGKGFRLLESLLFYVWTVRVELLIKLLKTNRLSSLRSNVKSVLTYQTKVRVTSRSPKWLWETEIIIHEEGHPLNRVIFESCQTFPTKQRKEGKSDMVRGGVLVQKGVFHLSRNEVNTGGESPHVYSLELKLFCH